MEEKTNEKTSTSNEKTQEQVKGNRVFNPFLLLKHANDFFFDQDERESLRYKYLYL